MSRNRKVLSQIDQHMVLERIVVDLSCVSSPKDRWCVIVDIFSYLNQGQVTYGKLDNLDR